MILDKKIKKVKQAQDDSSGAKDFDEWLSVCGPKLKCFRNTLKPVKYYR